MCKHLEDIIEVALICIYNQTYLRVAVSEQDFWHSGVVNGLIREVSVPKTFLNDTNLFYIPCDVCKHFNNKIEVALVSIYSQAYLRVAVSEQDFWLSRVVNRPVREVSVPRTFLNDTNIFYISHVMCANTWKT